MEWGGRAGRGKEGLTEQFLKEAGSTEGVGQRPGPVGYSSQEKVVFIILSFEIMEFWPYSNGRKELLC